LKNLSNKVILVTGTSKETGAAIAKKLAKVKASIL
jgi:NAD(P)-dependent dehydrogenase (short-subunit alcohol dehydrogenase family)